MPRHNGSRIGGHFKNRSGGNTRRLRSKKNTYAEKQSHPSPYWLPYQQGVAVPVVEREPRHRFPMPIKLGRHNKPPKPPIPQKPKEQGRGGRGGKGGKGR